MFQIIQVDKSVLVNRAALTEPTDIFVRSAPAPRQTGNKMASAMMSHAMHRRLAGSCPRMDSICEGSDEGSSSEGETASSLSAHGRLPPIVRPGLPPRPSTVEHARRVKRNDGSSFVTRRLPEPCIGKGTNSTTERRRACNCVEIGTNTSHVEQRDKATSTDGMCSVVVDGKMAECINKLRTVRQRLEQQQPSTPRNSSPPESTPATPPQPVSSEPSPPRNPSPTSSALQVTSSPAVSAADSATSTDVVEQACDQEDEVKQFILELKSRTQQETSPESKRLVQSVPGRRFVMDRKRSGNLFRQDRVPESPTSSPRPRRSNPTDATSSRPSPSQRSSSPRAITRNGRNVEGLGTQNVGSPTQRRSVATKKLPGINSPPAPRSGTRAILTDRPARPQSAKTEPTTPAGAARSPVSSPRKIRPARTSTAEAQRLATIDDEQAKSTSDSDSIMTHSGGSSDDQEPSGATRLPTTPKLARRQRLEMTQLLSVKSASLPDQQPGGATSVKQVRGSPSTARRANNLRHT